MKYELIENIAFRKPKRLGVYSKLSEVIDRVNLEMIKQVEDPNNKGIKFWSEVELEKEEIDINGLVIAGVEPIKVGERNVTFYCLEVRPIKSKK
jgi:hypothetical protein